MTKLELSDTTTSFVHLAEELRDDFTALTLRNVKITGDERESCDFWRVLRGHPGLTEFSWSNVTFEGPDTDVDRLISVLFISCPNLARVVIDKMQVPIGAIKSVEYCPGLRDLTLSNNHLTDDDAVVISEALVKNSNILKVNLRGNDMSEQGVKALQARVSLNKSIQRLYVDAEEEPQPNKDNFHRQNSATAA